MVRRKAVPSATRLCGAYTRAEIGRRGHSEGERTCRTHEGTDSVRRSSLQLNCHEPILSRSQAQLTP
eukprot:4453408-Prymnesium_polylepis.1